ncbi:MAG: sugar-binding protein [Armatimonadota bacterium]|nr:sugar-binding protein [Armatimonadota bacterium]
MKISRRALGLCALGTFSSLLLTGCPSSKEGGTTGSTGTTGSAGTTGGKKISVAFVTNNASDYWTIARKGTEQAQKEMPNVDVSFQIPGDGTAEQQKRIMDDLLAKGVQGIAISPVDPPNQTEEINAVVKRAVVFTQDSDAPQSNRACYVGTDNHAAGLQAGQMIKETLGPKGGKIMLFVGKRDAQNAKDRAQGIMDALKGTNITIIDTRTDDGDRGRAIANVSDTMVKYPDIAGLVGLWSYNGPAIVKAVKAAGNVGKVKIVCFDEEPDTLAGVKDGSIYGTVVQQPYEIGHQSILMMAKLIGGDKSVVPANKQVIIATHMIKQADVDKFSAQLHQLTGK